MEICGDDIWGSFNEQGNVREVLVSFEVVGRQKQLNPLHPNISMHILHTVLYTFPMVLTWRMCLTIKIFFSW